MKKYKLVGFLNVFGIVPDFVYPIFQSEDILYFQDGENDKINNFVPVKLKEYPRICKVGEFKKIIGMKNATLTVSSDPLYAFQVKEGEVFCGERELTLKFFEEYSVKNEVLKEEIEDLKKELINSAKSRAVQSILKTKYPHTKRKYYGVGRRKGSIAIVYLVPGTGKVTINSRDMDEYFGLNTLKSLVRQPLVLTKTFGKYDVITTVRGGGFTGQAGAISHGISKALLETDMNLRPVLKKAGFLTKNPHMGARKKYGLKAARRAPMISKR